MSIVMHKVASTNIAAIGHEGSTMVVQFHNGSVFHYAGVNQVKFDAVRSAKSVGSAFHKHVKAHHAGKKQ